MFRQVQVENSEKNMQIHESRLMGNNMPTFREADISVKKKCDKKVCEHPQKFPGVVIGLSAVGLRI